MPASPKQAVLYLLLPIMLTPRLLGGYIHDRLRGTVLSVSWDSLHVLSLVAFLFITLVPSESLAFSEFVEISHQPFKFARDPSLVDRAIVGIEAFPTARTAGGLLRSRSILLPDVLMPAMEGMALRVMSTAYSSTVDQTDGDPFTTASGTRVHPGTLAANFLPFGTTVRIGNQLYNVEDRLNARYNGKYIIDVWQPTRQAARQYGVKIVEMEIVTLPNGS